MLRSNLRSLPSLSRAIARRGVPVRVFSSRFHNSACTHQSFAQPRTEDNSRIVRLYPRDDDDGEHEGSFTKKNSQNDNVAVPDKDRLSPSVEETHPRTVKDSNTVPSLNGIFTKVTAVDKKTGYIRDRMDNINIKQDLALDKIDAINDGVTHQKHIFEAVNDTVDRVEDKIIPIGRGLSVVERKADTICDKIDDISAVVSKGVNDTVNRVEAKIKAGISAVEEKMDRLVDKIDDISVVVHQGVHDTVERVSSIMDKKLSIVDGNISSIGTKIQEDVNTISKTLNADMSILKSTVKTISDQLPQISNTNPETFADAVITAFKSKVCREIHWATKEQIAQEWARGFINTIATINSAERKRMREDIVKAVNALQRPEGIDQEMLADMIKKTIREATVNNGNWEQFVERIVEVIKAKSIDGAVAYQGASETTLMDIGAKLQNLQDGFHTLQQEIDHKMEKIDDGMENIKDDIGEAVKGINNTKEAVDEVIEKVEEIEEKYDNEEEHEEDEGESDCEEVDVKENSTKSPENFNKSLELVSAEIRAGYEEAKEQYESEIETLKKEVYELASQAEQKSWSHWDRRLDALEKNIQEASSSKDKEIAELKQKLEEREWNYVVVKLHALEKVINDKLSAANGTQQSSTAVIPAEHTNLDMKEIDKRFEALTKQIQSVQNSVKDAHDTELAYLNSAVHKIDAMDRKTIEIGELVDGTGKNIRTLYHKQEARAEEENKKLEGMEKRLLDGRAESSKYYHETLQEGGKTVRSLINEIRELRGASNEIKDRVDDLVRNEKRLGTGTAEDRLEDLFNTLNKLEDMLMIDRSKLWKLCSDEHDYNARAVQRLSNEIARLDRASSQTNKLDFPEGAVEKAAGQQQQMTKSDTDKSNTNSQETPPTPVNKIQTLPKPATKPEQPSSATAAAAKPLVNETKVQRKPSIEPEVERQYREAVAKHNKKEISTAEELAKRIRDAGRRERRKTILGYSVFAGVMGVAIFSDMIF